MGKVRVVKDFLPSPEQLVLREDSVKVTISLSKSSVDYFKRVASENRTQYQKLIRKVLDLYASHFMSQ
jgi:predicted DNA binding CopG/RHH family protein